MESVFEQLRFDLELAGYAVQTRAIYLRAVRDLADFYERSPATLGSIDVRRWVDRLAHSGISSQRRRQHHAALRFLYSRTLGVPNVTSFLSWPRDRERLPVVLSGSEVARLLRALRNPTYRVFFTLMYATGLRLREACLLETGDIDAARGIIRVHHGKGGRERIVMLSPRLLRLLRTYWSLVRPPAPWLFASSRGRAINAQVARNALRHAACAAGLGAAVTPRVLRHTFATHLLEARTDARVVQVLLGHRSIRTTTRYVSVSTKVIAGVESPFERLAVGSAGTDGPARPPPLPVPVGVSSRPMSKPKSRPRAPRLSADPDALLDRARTELARDGAIKLTAVGPPAVRPELVACLLKEGYEATKTVLRKPLDAQLSQALADGAFISLKSVASHVAGASSTEAKAAALRLIAAGKAQLVLRGTEEVVVPAGAPTLSRKELIALASFAKRVAKALGSKTGSTLLKADVAEELGALVHHSERGDTRHERAHPSADGGPPKSGLDSPMTKLLSAVDATRDPRSGLSFVPAIVAKLHADLDAERVTAALLEAAQDGLLELRPEGGIGRLSPKELSLCPPGPQGTRLSWARRPDMGAR